MPSQQNVDTNGYLTVKGCPLSSFGVFQYSAGQLGLTDRDPGELVNVYRPESEVSDPAAIASFQNLPFIDEHFSLSGHDDADESDLAPEDVGIDGILTGNVYYDAPWVRGDLKVFSRKLQKALRQGKRDLSLGYDCKYFLESGEFNGQPYEVVQRNMRGNHIALVEEGRVPGARVLDGRGYDSLSFNIHSNNPREETNVEEGQNQGQTPVEALRALLPQFAEAMKAFLGQEAGEAAHQPGAEAGAAEAGSAGAAEAGAAGAAEAAKGDEQSHQARENEHLGAEIAAEKKETDNQAVVSDNSGGDDLVELLKACLAKLQGSGEQAQGAQGMDNVEGLQNSKLDGALLATDNGEAGQGSSQAQAVDENALVSKAADSAVARLYADADLKGRVYDRVSALAGSFDSRAMDSAGVIAYGLKKFGLTAPKGAELAVLDAHIDGVNKATTVQLEASKAADSAAAGNGCEAISAYLKQGQ